MSANGNNSHVMQIILVLFYSKGIAPNTEIFQGMFDTIINFSTLWPSKFYVKSVIIVVKKKYN